MSQQLNAGTLIRQGASRLTKSPTALLDARTLFLHLSQWSHGELIAREGEVIPSPLEELFEAAIERRRSGEPIAHIIGKQEFFGRTFCVTPDVLIPRPETEMLVEAAIALAPRRVLDLGTGSGCILGSILAECPDATGEGWDKSAKALAVAQRNLDALGVNDRAALNERSFDNPCAEKFDVIVSNPPYIETAATLPISVREFEPAAALFAGEDGLDAYRRLAPAICDMLADGGTVLLEIGADQGRSVSDIFNRSVPGANITVEKDLAGLDRMVRVGRG